MTPSEYLISKCQRCTAKQPLEPHRWDSRTVADILDRPEYLGHTVNFRSTKRSFKDKHKIKIPKSEWKIFENTHEAIIDQETWNIVESLRENRHRPTKTGKFSLFAGKLFCSDCGSKLYYCTANNFKPENDFYRCSKYE